MENREWGSNNRSPNGVSVVTGLRPVFAARREAGDFRFLIDDFRLGNPAYARP